MKIPKSFELMGQTITVEYDKKLQSRCGANGLAVFAEKKIVLQAVNDIMDQEETNIVYLHELTHWIFDTLQENKLRDNEKLVQTFANLLYQSIKTSRY